MNVLTFFATLCALLGLASDAFASVKDPVYDEKEGLDLVEALIRDGKLDTAADELKRIPQGDRYWLVTGDLRLASQAWDDAYASCGRAAPSPQSRLCQAHAAAKLERFSDCARLYGLTQDLWVEAENSIIERALCEFRSQNAEEALKILNAGYQKFPSFAIDRERVSLLLEMNAVQFAFEHAIKTARQKSNGELLALAEIFHVKKFTQEALGLIEFARVHTPLDVDANLSAAQLYYGMGSWRATAEAFERAALVDGRYWYHASEIHRLAGHRQSASYCALLVPNSKEHLRARVAQYLDANRYPLMASLLWVFKRSELKDDDEVRYALAYSLFMQGNLDHSLTQVSAITRPEILLKAALLQKRIDECKSSDGLCSL